MADDIAIAVNNVAKSFKLPHEKQGSIKNIFVNVLNRRKTFEKQVVLENISFDIKKGEFFGIVGRNGSGKSTLLKLLAGIYSPNSGTVNVNGKLTPFIELGVGFSPELTGRENVYLNGALLGFERSEMEEMYEEIVRFAELERFMDQKLKNYSSGMQVRLAFSIAIRAKTDILLIDEVLAVGDTAFQKKCYEHFFLLKKQGKTVVLVTHDMSAVERFCTKAMVIHKGEQKGIMTPRKAARLYDELNSESNISPQKDDKKQSGRWGTKQVEIQNIQLESATKRGNKLVVEQGEDTVISFTTRARDNSIKDIVIGMAFFNQFGVNMAGPNTVGKQIQVGDKISFSIPKISFNPGFYEMTLIVFDSNAVTEYDHIEKALTFEVTASDHQKHGAVELFGQWSAK